MTQLLRSVGKVASVRIDRGWAVARYKSPKGAAEAIARLTDTELGGRKIFVREDREEASGGAGGRSAGVVTVVKPATGPSVTVAGLPFDITGDELKGIFASVGAVQATLGGARGSGTVFFRAPAQAQRAAADFNGALVNGRSITVRVK